MNLSFIDAFKPYVSRVLGSIIAGAAGYVSAKAHIVIDPSTQASVTAAVVVGIYGLVHKFIDKKINPADAASTHLTVEGQAQAAELKAQ